MKYLNLLGANTDTSDLEPFSKGFFSALGIDEYEQRESGNYVGGYYFKGKKGNLNYTLAVSDEDGNDDLPLWVQICGEDIEEAALEKQVESLIRNNLLPQGFRFARIVNFGKRGMQRVDY